MPKSPAALQVIEDPAQAASVLNPIRLRLLNELIEPDSAAGLARRLKLPRQAVTYHVRQLEADGLVAVVEQRKRRNCVERVVQATARTYVISPSALGALAVDPERMGERFSPTYFIAVAAQMIRDVTALSHRAEKADRRLITLTIQAGVRFTDSADQHAFTYELADAVDQLVTKYHREDAPEGPEYTFTVAGHPAVSGSAGQRGDGAVSAAAVATRSA